MRRADFERWSTVVGAFAVGGAFYHYVLFAIVIRERDGRLQAAIHDVVNQRAAAPYQYRVLVPAIVTWLEDHTPFSLGQVMVLLDGAMLVAAVALGLALLRRLDLRLLTLPVLLYCAFMMVGLIAFPKPETTTALFGVTASMLALERRPLSEGWWSPRIVWTGLVLSSSILVGCRTDLLVALAAGFAVRWWLRREWADAYAAIMLAAAAVIATVVLVHIYPMARYPSDTGLIQITWSISALPLVVASCFLAPALAPLALLLRRTDTVEPLQRAARAHLPALGVIVAEVLAAVTVGHVDEVRLFFPVFFCLATVGAEMWRAMVESVNVNVLSRE